MSEQRGESGTWVIWVVGVLIAIFAFSSCSSPNDSDVDYCTSYDYTIGNC